MQLNSMNTVVRACWCRGQHQVPTHSNHTSVPTHTSTCAEATLQQDMHIFIISLFYCYMKYNTHTYIYMHTNLHRAKNRENESEALAQDDQTVKTDWKRWNFEMVFKGGQGADRMNVCRQRVPSRRCRHRKGPRGKSCYASTDCLFKGGSRIVMVRNLKTEITMT